ncbi:Fur family transcriptional regulator [Comamonas sp. BIGb0124]|uniref:Fur family transcriptional regulator n=1 Tax=Comamonas sp. BIGb0124 TaxID=2485130 RepID=UPI001315A568|nr:transcriptional repressor [Comamonas sp. BIGb0124]
MVKRYSPLAGQAAHPAPAARLTMDWGQRPAERQDAGTADDLGRQARLQTARRHLASARLRPTLARLCALDALLQHPDLPVSVQTLYIRLFEAGYSCSLGTLYRAVGELARHGLVQREWDTDGNGLYSLKPDSKGPQGIQIVCRETRERHVVHDPALMARLVRSAKACGLQMVDSDVVIEVHCAPIPASAPSPASMAVEAGRVAAG